MNTTTDTHQVGQRTDIATGAEQGLLLAVVAVVLLGVVALLLMTA